MLKKVPTPVETKRDAFEHAFNIRAALNGVESTKSYMESLRVGNTYGDARYTNQEWFWYQKFGQLAPFECVLSPEHLEQVAVAFERLNPDWTLAAGQLPEVKIGCLDEFIVAYFHQGKFHSKAVYYLNQYKLYSEDYDLDDPDVDDEGGKPFTGWFVNGNFYGDDCFEYFKETVVQWMPLPQSINLSDVRVVGKEARIIEPVESLAARYIGPDYHNAVGNILRTHPDTAGMYQVKVLGQGMIWVDLKNLQVMGTTQKPVALTVMADKE